jgi:mannose-1-phosphate guanylyltransferase
MCPSPGAAFVVVMAGGAGKRFWPVSRRSRPKQALTLFSPASLLEETLSRVRPLTGPGRVLVNTSRELRPLLQDSCGPVGWIEEPWGMDTAACVGLSAAWAESLDPGSILALLPADHYIPEAEAFRAALREALLQAEAGDIVILGIRPTRPEPGYGYIEIGEPLGDRTFRVQAFREKPSAPTAEEYLRGGRHLWNAGMFVARASVLLAAFRMHRPALGAALDRILAAGLSPEAIEAEYRRIERISFDHAIMEKVSGVRVIRAEFAWDDVGSWLSMPRIFEAAEGGNVVRGRHAGIETSGCIIVAEDQDALVATAGVRDLVIVQSAGAVLVAHRGSVERLKDLVAMLEERKLDAWL